MRMDKNIYEKLFEIKKAWIKLTRDTQAFNYKYATLAQIQDKLSSVFEKQKVLVIHFIEQWKVFTQIRNIDWEDYVESHIDMSEWTWPQDKGSEITYYRRYNLLSLLDLEVDDDDAKKAQESHKKTYEDNWLPWIAQENIDNLDRLISEWKTFTMSDVKKQYKVSRANAQKLNDLWIK